MSLGDLQRIETAQEWQSLLARSPHATRFLDHDFLTLFDIPFSFYGLFRKGVCNVGMPVIGDGLSLPPRLPWCYYQGPIFYDEITRGVAAKQIQKEVELTEHFTTALAQEVDAFRFSLNPSFQDIRGYDWVHYHDPSKQRCQIRPNYTAILNLTNKSSDDLRKDARQSRRHEERYATTRENLKTSETDDIELIYNYYLQTFERQGASVSETETKLFRAYCKYFLDHGCGRGLCIENEDGEIVATALVFEDYDKTWHVPIVALGDTRYGGTLLYFHIADTALKSGGKAVDFNGANSPARSYFKHSLGARAQLFFEITYGQTQV